MNSMFLQSETFSSDNPNTLVNSVLQTSASLAVPLSTSSPHKRQRLCESSDSKSRFLYFTWDIAKLSMSHNYKAKAI